MATPTDDSEFLHDLENDVKAELTMSETGQPNQDAGDGPSAEDLPDSNTERYQVRLRTLLGAIEAVKEAVEDR